MSEAGVIILPPPREVDEAEPQENGDAMDTDPSVLKWPSKPGFPNYDLFDSEDSWYDSHPEGFSLTVSRSFNSKLHFSTSIFCAWIVSQLTFAL